MYFPSSIAGNGDSTSQSYSDTQNHEWWSNLNAQYQDLLTQLTQTPVDSMPYIQSQLENIQIDMQLAVLLALENSQELDSTSVNIWLSRADEILEINGQLIALFSKDSINQLIEYVNGLVLTTDDSVDRANFISSINWIQSAIALEKDIYHLDSADLGDLISLASLSFGNFTTLVRSFLNIYYNIRIDPPVELNQYSRSDTIDKKQTEVQYIIVPNPVYDCFEIISSVGEKINFEVKITDLNGKLMQQQAGRNVKLCSGHPFPPGIYFVHIFSDGANLYRPIKIIKF
ncbi:MAG: T9SS type A sorting domain-containing protein [Saprospiraceae bacterium]|nr:T9SS type A sorting domain-containing protein [Saprospiraceae bacterium]